MPEPKLRQSPFETLAIEVLQNPELATIRALALQTYYGAFLFALTREQMVKLVEMLKQQIDEMPNPS